MNTLNGYSKKTLTDSYLLGAGGGHIKDDFVRRSTAGLSSGKVAKIEVPANSNYLITLRGTNMGRNALVYVSGYGSGGTSSRMTIRIIYSSDKYLYYFNGNEDSTGSIYIKNDYTKDSDKLSVVSLGSTTVPTITLLESLPDNLSQITASEVSFLPLTGGTLTGDLTIKKGSGEKPGIVFQRAETNDSYEDWKIVNDGGSLKIQNRNSSGSFADVLTLTSRSYLQIKAGSTGLNYKFVGNLIGNADTATSATSARYAK